MVGSENTYIQFKGDGHTTVFEYPYDVAPKSELKALYVDTQGKTKDVTENITVEGRNVTYPRRGDAMPTGGVLVVYRDTEITQTMDFPDKYPYDNIETEFDYITRILQELDEKLDRSLQVPIHSSHRNLTIPASNERAFIGWSNTGEKLTTYPVANFEDMTKTVKDGYDYVKGTKAKFDGDLLTIEEQIKTIEMSKKVIEGFVTSAQKCVTQAEAINKDLSKNKADINNQIDMIHGVFEEIKKIRTAVEVINSTVTDNKLLTDANVTTSKQASDIALHCKNAIHDVLAQVTEVKTAIDNRTQHIIESIAKVNKGVDEATNQALLAKGYAEKARDIAGGDYVTHAEFTNVLKDKADKGEFASVEYVEGAVANVVDSAPETLNTLKELSKALNDDPNFATTISTQLGNKANATDVYNKSYIDSELHKRDIQLETMGKEKIKTTTGSEYAFGSSFEPNFSPLDAYVEEGIYTVKIGLNDGIPCDATSNYRLMVLNTTRTKGVKDITCIVQMIFVGHSSIWYRYKSMVDTKWGKWDKLVFKSDLDNLKNDIDSRVKMIDELFENDGFSKFMEQELDNMKSKLMNSVRIPTIPDMDLIFDGRKYNSKKGALNKKIYFTAPWDEYDILYVFYTLENSGTVSMSIVQSSIIKNLLNIAREMDLHMACIMDNVCGISTETLSTVWDVVYGHAGILYIYGYKQGGQVIPKVSVPSTEENEHKEPPKNTKEDEEDEEERKRYLETHEDMCEMDPSACN